MGKIEPRSEPAKNIVSIINRNHGHTSLPFLLLYLDS